jgi:hypothetical protein
MSLRGKGRASSGAGPSKELGAQQAAGWIPGALNSFFSPEDLCSNYLGTVVAERAIAAGREFNSAVTNELYELIAELDGLEPYESLAAFKLINGCWVGFDFSSPTLSSYKPSYLKRRSSG